MRSRYTIAKVFPLVLLFTCGTLIAQQPVYQVIRIAPVDGTEYVDYLGGLFALNDSSIVCYSSGLSTPFKWEKGMISYLPGFGDSGVTMDMNNQGTIVGFSGRHAVSLSDSGIMTDLLADHPEFIWGTAIGINSAGTIVGDVYTADSSKYPFIYDGTLTVVWDLKNAAFYDINDSGYVIGEQWTKAGWSGRGWMYTYSTIYYHNGNVTYINVPPPITEARSVEINNVNQVVGTAFDCELCCYQYTCNSSIVAYLWQNGNAIPLGELTDGDFTTARSINDSGVIVGCKRISHEALLDFGVKWENGTMFILDDLIDRTSGVHIEKAYDINNKGEILCWGHPKDSSNSTYLYLLTVPHIIQPGRDTVWIATDEPDTIKWSPIGTGKNLILSYSTDNGGTWTAIASDVPADAGEYAWDIPDTILSTKCKVMISDYATNDSMVASDLFKIKPYTLTIIDPDTGNFIAYDIAKDRWSFANSSINVWPIHWFSQFDYKGIDPFTGKQYAQYEPVFVNAHASDFPDWISWVNTFTEDACYWDQAHGLYSMTAVARWEGAKSPWRGACFGMTGTDALAFRHRSGLQYKFPSFPPGDLTLLNSDAYVIPVINEIFTHQFGNPTMERWLNYNPVPTQTLGDIRDMLRQAETPIRTLGVQDNGPGGGAHSLLAYKLSRRSKGSPLWDVYVYDCNYPNDANAHIVIDTSSGGGWGSWDYSHLPGWGGNQLIQLEELSSAYLGNAALPKSRVFRSPFTLSSGKMEINTTGDASIQVTDDNNNITGYRNDLLMRGIPGAVPLFIATGTPTPPYGYALPSGVYSVVLDSFRTAESRVAFFIGNRALSFERTDADSSQTDLLRFDTSTAPAISVVNPDPPVKSVMLKNIVNGTTEEKMFMLNSLDLSQYDSVAVKNLSGDRLQVVSTGSAKTYDLQLEYASRTQMRMFGKSHVSLSANTTHTIEPNWDGLRDSLLTILVDVGNNGTTDDTLKLQNELTGVHDRGSWIPKEYRLYPCYPNPFNPTTTVTYDLPKMSFVTLRVFNLLGQEVATLVGENQGAGRHEVLFDGSKLSTGLYFCRLEVVSLAGKPETFHQISKMMLLK